VGGPILEIHLKRMSFLMLPDPPDERLEHSPLALVVWQLRYDQQPTLATPNAGVRLHQLLGGREGEYPLLEEIQNATLSIQGAPGAVPAAAQTIQRSGWRVSNHQRSTSVVFATDALTVETSAYGRWATDFRPLVANALAALLEVAEPVIEHRVGLRYVDRMGDRGITEPSGWRGQLADWSLGAIASAAVGPSVAASELTHAIRVDEESSARLRISVFPDDGELTGVVDIDVFRENSRGLDAEDVLAAADRFRVACKQLFLASIEPALYEALRGNDA
jgi:uncharacterized protein (TIGR04255 family)